MTGSLKGRSVALLLQSAAFLATATLSNGSPVTAKIFEPRQQQDESESCAYVGNSDLYGLGIRLGFYFQMLATILAYHNALEDDIKNLVDVNGIFATAIAIATFVNSTASTQDAAHPAEIFLNLSVSICLRYSSDLDCCTLAIL